MTPSGSGPFDDNDLSDLRRVIGTLSAQVMLLQEGQDQHAAVVAQKDAEIAELKDEIARLKGLPPRPRFKAKPSGMEQATSKPAGKKGRKRGRGSLREKLTVTSEVKLKANAPEGARFRGYEDVLVQDLKISVEVVRYRRERWETADGERVMAPLPPDGRFKVRYLKHFPHLFVFVAD
jgi:hypothetical protein